MLIIRLFYHKKNCKSGLQNNGGVFTSALWPTERVSEKKVAEVYKVDSLIAIST